MKKTVLSLLLSLSTAHAGPITGNTLAGQIVDWPRGEKGEIRLAMAGGGPIAMLVADMDVASAPIDEEGRFSLTLPDQAALSRTLYPLEASGTPTRFHCELRMMCNGDLNVPAGMRFNMYSLYVPRPDGKEWNVIPQNNALLSPAEGQVTGKLVYVTAPGKVTGEFPSWDSYGQRVNVMDAEFTAGWNWLTASYGKQAESGNWPVKLAASDGKELVYRTRLGLIDVGTTLVWNAQGGKITAVTPGSPAQAAGLKEGDIISAVNGKSVRQTLYNNAHEIRALLVGAEGSEVKLTVRRDGQERDYTLRRTFTLLPLP